MPTYYATEEEFRRDCSFWTTIEQRINQAYQPNPWIFDHGYRPIPQKERYLLTYRNFDRSETKTFCFQNTDDGVVGSL